MKNAGKQLQLQIWLRNRKLKSGEIQIFLYKVMNKISVKENFVKRLKFSLIEA